MKQVNYKSMLTVLLAILLSLPTIAKKEYRVNGVVEFLAAIGDDRTIVLEQGPQYNLTTVLQSNQISKMLKNNSSKLSIDECFDGVELHINEVKNLTIRGAGDKPVRLVVEPRYAYVLTFLNCKNITIENLEIGHTPEQGYCDGGVLRFTDSENMTVQNCYLFGCGTEGADIVNSKHVYFKNTDIYECTYYIFLITGSEHIQFDKCRFYRNKEFTLINVRESQDIVLTECLIYENQGQLFYISSSITMKKCKIWHPKDKLESGVSYLPPGDYMSYIQQENCSWYDVKE